MMDEEIGKLDLFNITRVATATNISLSTINNGPTHQTIALVLECGDILFYHNPNKGDHATIQCIPWFEDPQKRIEAATFDPSYGNWFLVICHDSSLVLVPTRLPTPGPVDPDQEWSLDDVTTLPPLCGLKLYDFSPSAVAWWERFVGDGRYQSIAVIGGRRGEIIFANLRTGCIVGRTAVEGVVTSIQVCKDDTLLDLPPVFLIISNECKIQWKLVLEDRETGYFWPLPPEPSRTDSSASLISGIGSEEALGRPSMTSFPLARARLQGLKQLSVEKLASLRQKLSETRNRGLVNVTVKRRGSSSSEESVTRQRSSDSDSGGGGSGGPRLDLLSDTALQLQTARGKPLIVGHYAPADIVTVYGVGLSMKPVSIHRMPGPCHHVCLTDWLIYVTDLGCRLLTIVSYRLSQCRVDADKQILNSDVNPDSLLQQFQFGDGEEIQALYRISTSLKDQNDKLSKHDEDINRRKKSSHRSSHKGSGMAEQPCLDQCAVVTNRAVYKVVMRKSPREVVFGCVMNPNKIEKAERLCHMFGLDLQQLLEHAAEKQLDDGHLENAVALYKLARCRPVKSVLHMASAGFTHQLLTVTTGLLQTTQLSQTESLHLANLSVLTFTEHCLRAKNLDKVIMQFRLFLRDNHHYDEVLAVSVVGQSGLCSVLDYLNAERGLASQVLDVLARVINCQNSPALNCELCIGFWDCMSNTNLCQALVVKPDVAKLHINFVQSRLTAFKQDMLQRFANLYDPSQPSVRPVLKKLMLETINNTVNGGNAVKRDGEGMFPLSEWLTCYLLVCVYLGRRRSAGTDRYSPDLMVDLPVHPTLPTAQLPAKEVISCSPNLVSAGFTHVGLVRNNQLYTWGYTANGCLGVGPTLTQTHQPMPVPLFPSLGIQVLSVACGKLHTLALTTNGVYTWGSSKYGQLGVGPMGQSAEPRLVEGLYEEAVVAVVAGQYHSLALTSCGRVFTWGWGVHGQLGHGNVEDCCYPTPVKSLFSEVIVSCSGGHAHSLMLSSTGRVWACGSSVFGQLGTGSNLKSSRPVQVFGLPEKIISISTSYFHNLALALSNRLYTWGSSPQVLRLQAQAQKKARFQFHQQQAALAKEGRNVSGSGAEDAGTAEVEGTEPAEGSEADQEPTKVKPHFKLAPTSRFVTLNSEMVVSPSTEFKGLPTGRVAAEASNNIPNGNPAVGPSGVLVGIDDGLSHLSPTLVDTSHVEGRITKISCGCHHSALLTDTGQIYTWGRNLDAQLGNGARTKEALHPTHIAVGSGPSDLVTVECGGDFTLSVEANGKVWGWGSNQVGQLGKEPLEDATKAGLEGRLLMLKTSKRVIKLPHGSLNTIETPKEIPSLPSIQIAFQSHSADNDTIKPLSRLSQFENTPHGFRTLHYALSYFHGFYDNSKFREKCVELGDYQTASKLAMLDKQFDVAMSYQLQAALASSEGGHKPPSSVTSSQPSVLERASVSVVNTEVIVPTLEASLTVNSTTSRKIGISRAKSSLTNTECMESNGVESAKTQDKTTDDGEEKSTSEIHTFAEQGGAEEMSVRSQDTLCSRSDVVESRCETPDTLASSGCDDFVTKSSEVFDSPVKKCCLKTNISDGGESLTYETIVNKHIKDLEQNSADYAENAYVNSALIEDLVHIVEFYIDLCEQGPQTSLKALLKQGLEFWTDHKLPVCRLEALLLSHWSLVSYPLGLLLLGNDSEVSVDAQQMLSNLSTDFSLQLCSAMVNHVSDKDNNVPEVMELLSGLSWSEQTSASLTAEPLALNQLISQISCQQPPQPYIDINFTVSGDELTSPGEVISFSCGHKYDGTADLHKAAGNAARHMDDHSLASTAQALRGLYQQPLVVRHFACPTCILDCVTQEIG